MSDCCSTEEQENKKKSKLECPKCEEKCILVSTKTILHHLVEPWTKVLPDERYYFCRNSKCEVVYFSEEQNVITTSEVRTDIGLKNNSENGLICFCFGVDKAEALNNPKAKKFVVKMTKESVCSCDTTNPSGRCCLGDFPKSK